MFASTNSAPRAAFRLLGYSVLLVAVSALAVSAWAMGGPGGYHHGPSMSMMGEPAHLGRMADHMLDGLDATAAQRAQVKQIAATAVADLKTQFEAGRALREKGAQILMAPTLDAAAAETLRQQMLAQHDLTSKRVLQAMLDVANVLTPEQRAKLGERMKERGAMMRDRMQRMQQGSEHRH